MRVSKYNIFSKIKNSEDYFLINILFGSADVIDSNHAEIYKQIENSEKIEDSNFISELIEKQYVIDEAEEAKLYKIKYLDFVDSRDDDEVQLFFVPNYACNFQCSYCYQDEYSNEPKVVTTEVVDAFFQYINTNFSKRRKYITIFGGEPLLDSVIQKNAISYIISKANESNLEICFVTNGYSLVSYIDILKQAKIREIQVTLDGTAQVHDKRRFLKGGNGTFDKIVEGIDICLKNEIDINLRMVIDKENISELVHLSRFAIDKGWTKSAFFKTQIGRNYELHHCQESNNRLFDRLSLYEEISELINDNPEIIEFYKPSYSVSKFLFENGELPDPLFDSCPACKTEWAFDYSGSIYSCTATVGKADEKLGAFYPNISLNQELVEEWQDRDVLSIVECKDCEVQLACGGGCGSVAKNRTGKICSSDCRPIKGLLEIGMNAYYS